MQQMVSQLLDNRLTRRGFITKMTAAGFSLKATEGILSNLKATEAPPQIPQRNDRTVTGTGGELWIEQLKSSGVEYVFTNPGSTETGFFDALTDTPGMQLILGLHEGIVIAMADGYYQVSGKPGFVNIHAMPGTAQTNGQLYNAHMNHAALVVTAGLVDNTIYNDQMGLAPIPGFSQTDATKQFTKIAWNVRQSGSIPVALRRAFKVAGTPPGGPVYLAIATYAQSSQATTEIIDQRKFTVAMRPRPAADKIEELARRLLEGKQPLFVTSPQLRRSGAVEKAVELVEMLAVPIVDPTGSSFMDSGFPNQHPLCLDAKSFGRRVVADDRNPFEPFDVIVGLGSENVASSPGGAFSGKSPTRMSRAPRAWKAAIGLDTDNMGRTAPLDLPIVADPRAGLEDLIDAVKSLATTQRAAQIRKARYEKMAGAILTHRKQVERRIRSHFGQQPMHPDEAAMMIDAALDKDAITVNENLSHDFSLNYHAVQRYGGDGKIRLAAFGGGLGWGVGAAVGAKLGQPDRQVLLNIGDGSVMYSASGFWTMARYRVPVLTIIWNNVNYQTVRQGFAALGGKMAQTGHFPAMYLGDPEISFVQLVQSQGVEGQKATTRSEFRNALQRGLLATRRGEPFVIDLLVGRIGPGAQSNWHQDFSLAQHRTRKV